MKKFRVWGKVVGTKYLGVHEAQTAEAAEEMAIEGDQGYIRLCHRCSDQCEDPEIVEATAEEIPDEDTP
jgi:hypothetical protein